MKPFVVTLDYYFRKTDVLVIAEDFAQAERLVLQWVVRDPYLGSIPCILCIKLDTRQLVEVTK